MEQKELESKLATAEKQLAEAQTKVRELEAAMSAPAPASGVTSEQFGAVSRQLAEVSARLEVVEKQPQSRQSNAGDETVQLAEFQPEHRYNPRTKTAYRNPDVM